MATSAGVRAKSPNWAIIHRASVGVGFAATKWLSIAPVRANSQSRMSKQISHAGGFASMKRETNSGVSVSSHALTNMASAGTPCTSKNPSGGRESPPHKRIAHLISFAVGSQVRKASRAIISGLGVVFNVDMLVSI